MSASMNDFVAGTAGGCAAKLLDYPLDTVKVLLQTQSVGSAKQSTAPRGGRTPVVYRGAWHCLVHTVETRGWRGLYTGITSPLLGSMAENALLFYAYGNFKKALGEVSGGPELSLMHLSLAGAGAGATVPLVLTPVELVKCRLQVQSSASSAVGFRRYKGPVDVIKKTLREEGFAKGLYRGNTATLLREVPGNFMWYGTYEGICKLMAPEGGSKKDVGPSVHLLGGALAGVMYWTAFYPADTVKSMIQSRPDPSGKGFAGTFLQIYRNEGVAGLYRGWGVTVARAAPAHALIFATYEATMNLLNSSKE